MHSGSPGRLAALLVVLLLAGAGKAGAMSLEEYVRHYLSQSARLSMAQKAARRAALLAEIADDRYKTSLQSVLTGQDNLVGTSGTNIVPNATGTGVLFQPYSTHFRSKTRGHATSLNQTLGLGSTLSLRFNESRTQFDNDTGDSANRDHSVHLNHALWRNFGGALEDLRSEQAGLEQEAARQEADDMQLQECLAAGRLYLDAWFLQEQAKLYDLSLKDAREMRDLFTRLYKGRHVQKIEYLRARQDFLTRENLFADRRQAVRQARLVLENGIGRSVPPVLQEPALKVIEAGLQEAAPATGLPALKKYDLRRQAAEAGIGVARQTARSDVNLTLSAGRAKLPSSGDILGTSTERDYMGVSLSLSLPLRDRSREVAVHRAVVDHEIAGERLREAERESRKSLDTAVSTLGHLRRRSRTVADQVGVAEQQLAEAKVLVKSSRYDLTNYILDRTAATAKKIEYLENRLRVMTTILSIRQLTSQAPAWCPQNGAVKG